ncbi:MAG: hypothetical protein V3V05_13030 [Pontiella sp.]
MTAGAVAFLDVDGVLISSVTAGALPDMVTFAPNGKKVSLPTKMRRMMNIGSIRKVRFSLFYNRRVLDLRVFLFWLDYIESMKDLFKRAREWVWLEGDPAKDRSVELAVCGTLEIMLGFLCFALAMLLLLVVSSSGLGGMKPVHFWMAMGCLFYLTGWFIVMGLGSVKARRWARALVLVGAWVAVFFGTLILALVLYILPEAHNLLTESELISPDSALLILYFTTFVLAALQVVFPLSAIAFYSLRGVQRTCERRNPEPSWTDRCPLPLLAMGFISVLGSFTIFFGATTNFVVFLFGHVESGWSGLAIELIISMGFAYVGWGAFNRKMHAWWGAYALVLLTSSSMMLTFSELEMSALYVHMGYSQYQMAQMVHLKPINPTMLTFVSGVWGIMACIYLVWVRDCFRPEAAKVVAKSYTQLKAEEEAAKPAESRQPRMRLED